jgi:tetratricopeptide (TPR) repeat protein
MAAAFVRLDADADNLAAAMRWSLASAQPEVALRIGGAVPMWLVSRPSSTQYGEWLQRAVAQGSEIAPRYRAKALSTIGFWGPDPGDRYAAAQKALALAYRTEDPRLIGWTLYETGHVGGGRLPRDALEEALEIARAEGDRGLFVHASIVLALYYTQTPAERKALLEEILPQAPRYSRMFISSMASVAALQLGQLEEAKRWSEATLSGWTDLGNVGRLVAEPLHVAWILMLQGDYDRAWEMAIRAADLARRGARTELLIYVTLQMGEFAFYRGDQQQAAHLLSEALEMTGGQSMYAGMAGEAQTWLSLVACEQEKYDQAEALCGEVLDRLPKGVPLTRWALDTSARIALCRGDAARAVELYRRCLEHPMRIGHRVMSAEATEHLAWALAEDGQAEEAARLLACAAHEREDMGIVLYPIDRPYHERAMEAVQAVLAGRFPEVWAQGEALDVASALAQVHGADPSP